MASPPQNLLQQARDAIERGAPPGAVLARLRESYDVPPDLEAALTGARFVQDQEGNLLYDAANPGQTPRPMSTGEVLSELTKAGFAGAGANVFGALESARVAAASNVSEAAFGDPNERRVFGQVADRLRAYRRARTDEADPRLDLPLALDEIVSGGIEGAAALPIVLGAGAIGGPAAAFGVAPALYGGAAYDESKSPTEALKAAGIAALTQGAGRFVSRAPSLPVRLGAGAVIDAGIAAGGGQDIEGIAANVITGLPWSVGYTGAKPQRGARRSMADLVEPARSGAADAADAARPAPDDAAGVPRPAEAAAPVAPEGNPADAPAGRQVDVPEGTGYRGAHSNRVLGPEARAWIDDLLTDPTRAAELERQRGGRITVEETEARADAYPLTREEAADLPQRTLLPVEGVARLKRYAKDSVAGVKEARADLESAQRSGDAQLVAAAQLELESRANEAAKIGMAYLATGSEAGRALGFRSYGERRTRSELLARRGLRMAMDDTTLRPAEREALAARIMAAGDDPAAIMREIQAAYLPRWQDKLMELRVNNLISSAVTITRNVVGNAAATASRLVENATGYLVDLPVEGVQRLRGAGGSANRRRAREITADLAGSLHGATEGARLAWRALRDENFALSQGRIPEEALKLPAIEGRLGVALRTPSRIQSAADLLFYQINAEGRRSQLAMRQALHEGHRGRAATQRATDLLEASRGVDLAVAERVARGKLKAANDAERIAGSAHAFAQEYTFRNPLERFGQAAEQMRQADNFAGAATRFVIPFFRTPVNLGKFTAQRSLLGFISPRNWRDLRSGNRERATASIARMGLGTGIAYALASYAMQGHISGAGPDDRASREALKRTGWQPHSVRIGDEWYSYRGFSPVSEQLAAAATLAETWTRNPTGEVDLQALQRIGLAIARTNLEQPMWTGVADLMNAIRQSDEDFGERKTHSALANMVTGTVVPRAVAWAARSVDPTRRAYAETFVDQLLQQAPGTREITLPFRDPLGRTFDEPEGALAAFVPHTSDRDTSPLDRWLVDIQDAPDRAVVDYPSRTQLGRRLAPEDYDQLLQARGELLLPVLNEIRKGVDLRAEGGAFQARKAVGDAVADLGKVATTRVVPPAELRALGIPDSPEARQAVLLVMNTAPIRNAYAAPERTDAEKRLILDLVLKAPNDPAAATALRRIVLGEP